MKRYLALFCLLIVMVPATSQARTWYGDADIKGKIILNGNDIDTAGNIGVTVVDADTALIDTGVIQRVLDMDSNAIKNIDWNNSDTSSLRVPNADVADTAIDSAKLNGLTNGNDSGNIAEANGQVVINLVSDTAQFADNVKESNVEHGDLNGLLDDDHTQYLLDDGTDSMSGDLDMNNNSIDSAFLVLADTVGRRGSDTTVFVGVVDCASNEYLSGSGCREDQQSIGASLVVQDDGVNVDSQTDTMDLQRNVTASQESNGNVDISTFLNNYLDPSGLVINTGGVSDSASLEVGGDVYVSDPAGDTNQRVINIEAGDTINLNQTGCNGLINSSDPVEANTWYELGISQDIDNGQTCMVAWKHTSSTDSTPTSTADLPSGHDVFRAMGTPGKTWWVLTDGSSNIHDFDHSSDGILRWTPNAFGNFSVLSDQNPPTTGSNQTVDISNQIPPTKVNISLNDIFIEGDSGGDAVVGFDVEGISDKQDAQIVLRAATSEFIDQSEILKHVGSQEINFLADSNTNRIIFRYVATFKAVN